MSTPNFCYENRCIAITDEDINNDNLPEIEDRCHSQSNPNYCSYLLKEQPEGCGFLQAVITCAYYEGACLDYLPFPYDGMTDEEMAEAWAKEDAIMDAFLDQIRDGYGYQELICAGIFSNGEAIYKTI